MRKIISIILLTIPIATSNVVNAQSLQKAHQKNPYTLVYEGAITKKEQTAGLYAERLAEAGYVTIAADAAYQGASGGEPRHTDKPVNRIEDIHGMADYISRYPGVDPNSLGVLGICGGGGYTLKAAQNNLCWRGKHYR